jgi:hypothetical protein
MNNKKIIDSKEGSAENFTNTKQTTTLKKKSVNFLNKKAKRVLTELEQRPRYM